MTVAARVHDPVMDPRTLTNRLIHARLHATPQDYRDELATTAALTSVSNVNATARLLELLTNAAAKGTQL